MLLPNHIWRYAPVVRWFKHNTGVDALCWLETGSGTYGIGPHMPARFRFVGCDYCFDQDIDMRMLPVRADARRLPFASRSFDGVLTLDMLEHIAPASRQQVVSELARVARRWVIIGFPCDTAAEKVDRWLGRFYAWRNIPWPVWLIEHFQHAYPSLNDVNLAGWQKKSMPNEHVLWHLASMILETRQSYQRFVRFVYAQFPEALHFMIRLCSLPPAYRYIIFLERDDRPVAGDSNL